VDAVDVLDVHFHAVGTISEEDMSYAVIAAKYGEKWLFVRQKARHTWEIPGGRKEPGELVLQTAQRELFEETGALDYRLQSISDYSVTREETRHGRLFLADILNLGPLPESEIAQIIAVEDLPAQLTYPAIQPLLLWKVQETLGDIVEVSKENMPPWVEMGVSLWPDHSFEEMRETCVSILDSQKETGFLCRLYGEYVGFINVSIRADYVEGSSSSPVGYVEGIYVQASHRKRGIAKRLLQRAESWARSKGCTQMGSDIELGNTASYAFHKKAGFQEANRIICLIKDID
jgi:aminoglycoside 6'-N-acetyltransferase I